MKWQGRPYLVPLRHVRKHLPVLLVLNQHASNPTVLSNELIELMDIIDGQATGKLFTQGLIHDAHKKLKLVPTTWTDESTKPKVFALAEPVSRDLFHLERIDGIRYGHALRRMPPVIRCRYALLISWQRGDRAGCQYVELSPTVTINLTKRFGPAWDSTSTLMLFVYQRVIDDESRLTRTIGTPTNSTDAPSQPSGGNPPSTDWGSTIDADDVTPSDPIWPDTEDDPFDPGPGRPPPRPPPQRSGASNGGGSSR